MILETLVVSPFATNCYIVGCPDTKEGAVIDPGDSGGEIAARAVELGLTVKSVILTHGHVDHVSGAHDVLEATGAELIMHKADEFLLEATTEQAAMFGWFLSNPVPAPGRFVEEGDVLKVGRLSFEVLHTPGHSPGCISLKGDGHVFVGDLIFAGSIGRTDLPGGSTQQLLQSVRDKIFPLPDEMIILNGHGPSTEVGTEKRSNPFFQEGAVFGM